MKIFWTAVVAASLCANSAAAVEVQCAKHSLMMDLLTKKFSERPIALGTVNQDRYMQLFVSSAGTWTILMTETSGRACILAAGENWEALPKIAANEPSA
jgi:hypothetical protein